MDIFKRPFTIGAVCITVVSILSYHFTEFSVLFILIALAVLVFCAVKIDKKYIFVLLVVFASFINLILQYKAVLDVKNIDGKTVHGKFTIVSEPVKFDEYTRYNVKPINSKEIPNNTKYLFFDYTSTNVFMGDVVEAEIKLSSTDGKYRLYDYGNSVFGKASVKKLDLTGERNSIYKFAANIRKFIKNKISSNFDAECASLIMAITIGDTSNITDEFSMDIQAVGIGHILVVSGLHLSIIMSGVYSIIDRIFYNKYLRAVISSIILFLICLVCGFAMSVIRAAVMFAIASFAPVFNRNNDLISSLMTSFCAILAVTPFAIFNVSFQLSVLATLAIIWTVPFYLKLTVKYFNISSKKVISILKIIYIPIFSMVFTLPVVSYIFGFVSVLAPITNLLVTFAVTALLALTAVALICSVIPILKLLTPVLFLLASWCAKYIIFVVNTLAKLPITIAIFSDAIYLVSILLILFVIIFMYIYEYSHNKKRSDFFVKL